MSKKLRAFTFIEILVVMLLSGIVIGAIITVFLNVSKFVAMSNQNLVTTQELIMFERQIVKDLTDSETFDINGNEIGFYKDKIRVFYEMTDSLVIRYHNYEADTFKLTISDYDYQYSEYMRDYLEKLVLYSNIHGLEYPIVLNKKPDNSFFINFEIQKQKLWP